MWCNDNNPRRHSSRLKDFDYASAGAYFITICAYERECFFGRIEAGVMCLSDAGSIVKMIWDEIPTHYASVAIDEFVVMPNHIHGIIINTTEYTATQPTAGARFIAPKTVGEIVRAFKARCTHAINQSQTVQGFHVWQRNYYEHVIRSEKDLTDIREYIVNNPLQWDLDENNPHTNNSGTANDWESYAINQGVINHAPTSKGS